MMGTAEAQRSSDQWRGAPRAAPAPKYTHAHTSWRAAARGLSVAWIAALRHPREMIEAKSGPAWTQARPGGGGGGGAPAGFGERPRAGRGLRRGRASWRGGPAQFQGRQARQGTSMERAGRRAAGERRGAAPAAAPRPRAAIARVRRRRRSHHPLALSSARAAVPRHVASFISAARRAAGAQPRGGQGTGFFGGRFCWRMLGPGTRQQQKVGVLYGVSGRRSGGTRAEGSGGRTASILVESHRGVEAVPVAPMVART